MDINKLEKEREIKRRKHIKDFIEVVQLKKEIRKNNKRPVTEDLKIRPMTKGVTEDLNLNKLEKERERKQRKHIKDTFETSQMRKEIRQNNEDELKEKLGIQKSLETFHKPVTETIENYEKSNKEIVKGIQNTLENISFPPLESSRFPEIEYEPFERLFEERPSVSTQTKLKMKDIIDPLMDEGIDKKLITEKGLKLPSELFNENLETINEAIEKAQTMRKDIKPYLGSAKSAIARTRKQDVKEKYEAESHKNQHIFNHLGLYIDSLNNIVSFRNKRGKGIDLLDLLSKLTDKICKSGKISKKLYIEIVSLLDILLKNGTMTHADVQQYHKQFLS